MRIPPMSFVWEALMVGVAEAEVPCSLDRRL